jgi:non-canonical poly(A) RNA polymerase PAPD5/7
LGFLDVYRECTSLNSSSIRIEARNSRILSRLHREVEHFMAYMKPTNEEAALRKDLVGRFTRLLRKLAPGTALHVVGSSATGLYFPTSDIEMVIAFPSRSASKNIRPALAILEDDIRKSRFSSRAESDLQGAVPVLRITDASTGIDIVLKGSDERSVRAREVTKAWMDGEDGKVIGSLVMVLKLFLSIRRLGTSFTGGIDSKLLVWMVVAYVKLEMRKSPWATSSAGGKAARRARLISQVSSSTGGSSNNGPGDSMDLGEAFLGFLRFYGQEFDYTSKAIIFTSTSVCCPLKPSMLGPAAFSPDRPEQEYLLCLTDPADSAVDIGAKAYSIKHVRETFRDAYVSVLALVEGTATRDELVKARFEGILGSCLGGDYSRFISKRKRIIKRWRLLPHNTLFDRL